MSGPVTREFPPMIDQPKNLPKAIIYRLGASLLFAMMAVLVRYLGSWIPVGEMIFFRGFFAMFPLVVFFALRRELLAALQTKRLGAHFLRGSISIIGSFSYFGALTRLPVADTTAISFLTPLITVALAAMFLGEIVHLYRWSAVIAGFLGVIIMLVPYFDLAHHAALSDELLTGVVLALLNAVTSAFAVIQIRRLMTTEKTTSIVIYFSAFVAIGGLTTLPLGWAMPTTLQLAALITIGLCGGVAHLLTTTSYRHADASSLAPFDYSSMIWAFLLGYFLFGEVPAVLVVIGAVMIAAAGLVVVWRERQLGMMRSADEDVVPARS